jgi:hypothetical protein
MEVFAGKTTDELQELKKNYAEEYAELVPLYNFNYQLQTWWPGPLDLMRWLDRAVKKRASI